MAGMVGPVRASARGRQTGAASEVPIALRRVTSRKLSRASLQLRQQHELCSHGRGQCSLGESAANAARRGRRLERDGGIPLGRARRTEGGGGRWSSCSNVAAIACRSCAVDDRKPLTRRVSPHRRIGSHWRRKKRRRRASAREKMKERNREREGAHTREENAGGL